MPAEMTAPADIRHAAQKRNARRTQVTRNQRLSRLAIARPTKSSAINDSQMSAGVLSISRMKGPRRKKREQHAPKRAVLQERI